MEKIYKLNSSIDMSLASIHGFIKNNELTTEYTYLQKKYYILLEWFLCQKVGLKEIEISLDKSGLFINNRDELIKTVCIKNLQLSYFFVRNNLNIEVLSSDELNILRTSEDKEQLSKLIETTFLKVINVNSLYGKKIDGGRILYDGTGESYLKGTSSLIIGFIDDYNSKKISDEEWDNFYEQRNEIIDNFCTNIKNEAMNKLNCNVEFIEYSLSLLEQLNENKN